jgi:hypothetical protein
MFSSFRVAVLQIEYTLDGARMAVAAFDGLARLSEKLSATLQG